MQVPKGVQIGEINDSLAQPRSYLYNLYAMLHSLIRFLTSPSFIEPSPYFSSPPHTLYAESNRERDRSPMGLH